MCQKRHKSLEIFGFYLQGTLLQLLWGILESEHLRALDGGICWSVEWDIDIEVSATDALIWHLP